MLALARYFLQLIMLRLPPQVFPASGFLFSLTLLAYLGSGFLYLFATSGDPVFAAARALLGIVNISLGAGFILGVSGRRHRWQQTVTALMGGETLIVLMLIPLVLVQAAGIHNAFLGLASLLFLVWEVIFFAHVYRNALDTGMTVGIMVAVAYIFISMLVKQALLPFPAEGQ